MCKDKVRYQERTRIHYGSDTAISWAGAAGVEGGAQLVLSRAAHGPRAAPRWGPEPGPDRCGHRRMGAKAHREIALAALFLAHGTTTQIYTHVMSRPGLGVRSPLDMG